MSSSHRGGGCGHNSDCPKPKSHTPIPFYGVVDDQLSGTTTTPLTPEIVPLGEPARFGTLAVTIDTAVAVGSSLVIEVLRNGVAVKSITYGGTNPATGYQRLRFSTAFAQGDTVGLQAVATGPFAAPTNIAASLTPR